MMDKNTIEETIIKNVKAFNKIVREGKFKNLTAPVKHSKYFFKKNLNKEYCPYCNRESILIWVHSHYQCQNCKNVVIDCCGDK